MRQLCFLIVAMLFWLFSSNTFANQNDSTVVVVPGEKYAAGSVHELFFGHHWRSLWTTPIEVRVLDLDSFAGGLRPLKRGGGQQTKSLRLLGADGIQYKFRSIDKDPTKVLPGALRISLAADVISDQISTAHPTAALIVSHLSEAAGVIQAKPILVVLPDSDLLGEFREEFGGVFGTLEVHPDEGDEDTPGFLGADNVKGTFSLLNHLEDHPEEYIHSASFLRARLFDIFLGDWDRHTDQWRWARFDQDQLQIWYPIPRDRDQAFARYTGLFPWIASKAVRQLEGFSEDYPHMEYLTWSGRFLDRRILPWLPKHEWVDITLDLQSRLTDSVIEFSVSQMPQEWVAKEGEGLVLQLKSRRDKLLEASMEFRELVFEVADVWLTDEDEIVQLWYGNDSLYYSSYCVEDSAASFKEMIWASNETDEVRIHLHSGHDSVYVHGDTGPNIILINENKDNYYRLKQDKDVLIFDREDSKYKGGDYARDKKKFRKPKDDFEKYEPQVRDRGSDWRFKPVLSVNSSDGLILGGGPIYYTYAFAKEPFETRSEVTVAAAPAVNRYKATFSAELHTRSDDLWWTLSGHASELERMQFFGFGNETSFSEELDELDFYEVNLREARLDIHAHLLVSDQLRGEVSLGVRSVESNTFDESRKTLIDSLQPYGAERMMIGDVALNVVYDSRDSEVPTTGVYATLGVGYTPKLFDTDDGYVHFSGDIRAYTTLEDVLESTVAVRMKGDYFSDNVPFFDAAYLGGGNSLRGYERERFSGDASAMVAGEWRIPVSNFFYLFPMQWGVHGFGETGRVFVQGEQSEKWHAGYGGGVWISIVDRAFTMSTTYGRSSEMDTFYVIGGFGI